MKEETSAVFKILLKILFALIIVVLILNVFAVVANKFGLTDIFGYSKTVEQVSLDNGIKGKTNGGLTIQEIEQQLNDDDTPLHNDIFKDFYVVETEKYVVIYRAVQQSNGLTSYPNLSFVKTSRGLIWDGAWNVSANANTNWWTGYHDWNNFSAQMSMTLSDYSLEKSLNAGDIFGVLINLRIAKTWQENIVTFSDFNVNFANNGYFNNCNAIALLIHEYDQKIELYNRIHAWLIENIVNEYFLDITDILDDVLVEFKTGIENVNDSAYILSYLNSFATYAWENSKSSDKSNKTSVLDLNNYYIAIIPEDLQSNYPISASKLAEYNGRTNYGVYVTKIMGTMHYSYSNAQISRNDSEITKNTSNIPIAPKAEVTTEYIKLTINLNNSDDSDITHLDLVNNPVSISLGDKSVIFDSISDLTAGIAVAISINTDIFYTINSNALVFTSYSGSFTVSDLDSTKTFDYTYQHGYVQARVSLAQISNTNTDSINLSTFPVRIIFTGNNGEGTYQFVFDNNSKLDLALSQYVKIGSYTYSVLSEQLIFGSTTGNITIDSTEREFIFTYSVNTYQNDVRFTINVSSINSTSSTDLKLSGSASSVDVLSEALQDSAYKVVLKIFDSEGYLLFTGNHLHSASSATCGHNWQSNGVLTTGVEYTGQMLYLSNTNPDLSYVSGTFTFTFDDAKVFTFTYTAETV
jgi:hypothetical protein